MLLLNGKLRLGCRVKFVKFWPQSLLPASPHQELPHRAGGACWNTPPAPLQSQTGFYLWWFSPDLHL